MDFPWLGHLPLISVVLFALALGIGTIALRAKQRRQQAIRGGIALLLVLTAAGVLWWPVGSSVAPLTPSLRLYVGSGNSLVALQASTGSLVWNFQAAGFVQGAPVVVGGVVYFGSNDSFTSGSAYALKASDGTLLWQTRLDGAVQSSPAVSDGVLYLSSRSGMDALKASDGSLLWHAHLATTSSNPSSPTLVNGLLYLGAGGPPPQTPACVCVYALQASDGSEVWKHPTGDQVFAAPTVRDGVVYASEFTDGLFALRASDGLLLWSQPGMEGSGSPTIVDGVIYINGYDQQTYALHASDGSQVWHTQVGNGNGAPLVSDGVVYVGTNVVLALRASDGTLLWRSQESDHLLFSTPSLLQGVVFATGVCTDEFNFSGCKDRAVALKGSDGSLLWSKNLARPSAPVLGP